MKLKQGVVLAGLKIEMRPVLIKAAALWAQHGQELVVTCGLDGTHSPGSLHYYGYALDFRTRYFDHGIAILIKGLLQRELGPLYQVILHETHMHVQYKPKFM